MEDLLDLAMISTLLPGATHRPRPAPQTVIPGLYIQYYEQYRHLHGDRCPNQHDFDPQRPVDFHDRFRAQILGFRARSDWVKQFAWAIPSPQALLAIKALNMPICEIGAGKGYWGYLLRCLGVECYLYDLEPPPGPNASGYRDEGPGWTWVERGDATAASLYPDAALFVCWPPYGGAMAYEALQGWRGEYFLFIGEDGGGCTADDQFYDLLERDFDQVEFVHLPQYMGIHDDLTIHRRKSASGLRG